MCRLCSPFNDTGNASKFNSSDPDREPWQYICSLTHTIASACTLCRQAGVLKKLTFHGHSKTVEDLYNYSIQLLIITLRWTCT